MSSQVIEDIERLSLVSRLGRPVKAGDTVLRFRAIPEGIAGEQIIIDPFAVSMEIATVLSSDNRDVTLTAGLTYAHEINAPIIRNFMSEYALNTVNVDSFGAEGDGTTDDTAAIKAAWDSLSAHGRLIFSPQKTYAISDTLLFDTNKNFCVIEGNGATITVLTGTDMTGKPMLNLAGSAFTKVYNLNLSAPSAVTPPIVGLLLGRTAVFHGSRQKFDGCHVTGYFTFAAYYNVGSEVSTFIDCTFQNYQDNAHAAYISNDDSQSLLALSAGQLTGYYYSCVFHCFGTGGYNLYLKGYVADHAFFGCYGVPSIGGHFIHPETGAGTDLLTNCTFDNLRLEYNAGDNSDTRLFYLPNGMSAVSITFRNIGWNMNSGVAANDPDYIYEIAGSLTGSNFHTTKNTFGKQLMLIKSTATITECRFWGSVSGEVTSEAGATYVRTQFFWQDNQYPFDATPAAANLVQWVVNKLSTTVIFTDGDATPSVGGGKIFQTNNTGATTITDFDDGVAGQEIWLHIGDNVTTLDFSSSDLLGNNGVDYTASYRDTIYALFDGFRWRCFISQS